MTLTELAGLVEEMRDAQRKFFRTKHDQRAERDHWLDESRRLERRVDEALREVELARDPQRQLFV